MDNEEFEFSSPSLAIAFLEKQPEEARFTFKQEFESKEALLDFLKEFGHEYMDNFILEEING